MTAITSAPLAGRPALVLNADFRPLSYYPLSLWSWQDTIKAVFLDRVQIIAEYDSFVSSPSFKMRVPSVIALREYIPQDRPPAFTRFNLFLRDGFACAYCGSPEELTFDHVVPRHLGGRTSWENIVAACSPCNFAKGGRNLPDTGLSLAHTPYRPTHHQLQKIGQKFPPHFLHETWMDYLYWDSVLEA